MNRRSLLAAGCGLCAAAMWTGATSAQTGAFKAEDWTMPNRYPKPDLSSDEGGFWALVNSEEARLRRSPFLMRDAALTEYVQGIVCKLAGPHCADLRAYIVHAPFFNATVAPNGMIQVWSGLLLRIENEAQLAAILAHEISHYLLRHMLPRLRDGKSRSAFMALIAGLGVPGMLDQLAALAGAFSFSIEQEREADALAMRLTRDAGYDTRETLKLWTNLRAEAAASGSEDLVAKSPMFATHPQSSVRIAELAPASVIASKAFIGEAEYAQRVAGLQRRLLEDEIKRSQPAESLVLLSRLIASAPERADLLYFRGETLRLRAGDGDLAAAVVDLDLALTLSHAPAEVHRALGYIHQKSNRQTEARTEFARYVELAPEAPDAKLIRTYIAN